MTPRQQSSSTAALPETLPVGCNF